MKCIDKRSITGANRNFNDHGMAAKALIVATWVISNPCLERMAGMAHQINPMGAPSEKYKAKNIRRFINLLLHEHCPLKTREEARTF